MSIKILVVDDSASDRLIIKNMLSEYCILTACDGVEALRVLEEYGEIDLLILDLNMPNMDGFQVLEALQKDERFKGLRTIILTNYDELDNEIKGLRLGAVDYIRKPIHMDSLKARIEVHVALLQAKQALEQQLDNQVLTFDMIFDQAPIGIAISHDSGPKHSDESLLRVNSMYEQITGRTKEELVDLGWASITPPDDSEEDLENFRKLQAGEIERYSMEKRYIKPDGSLVWVNMLIAALAPDGENKVNHICLIEDITERKEIEDKLRYFHEHDRWTGLYNREYLENLLEKHSRQKYKTNRALISINLSTVQLLTANYGFNYTQKLMRKAAETLSCYCTDQRILFNTYENRFAFYVLDYKGKSELLEFSEAIAESLESLFKTERVGGGIGILEIDKYCESTSDVLLKKLIIASERASGIFDKDFSVCFYDEALEALIDREGEIRRELARIADDDCSDELYLLFQPILDLGTDSISGFEALARLRTEKLGLVMPLDFIPIAEKTKLIIPLGMKIIVSALRFMQKLEELGYGSIGISINISAIQLFSPEFTSDLLGAIEEMHVNPLNIGIEITESIFTSDYEYINNTISTLRTAGLRIAIDDFGTGYSSLAREKALAVDCLKIDKYFIDKLLDSEPDEAITEDIISMAHKLGHCAIAEGVEQEEQRQYLLSHGCDKIQGYLIGRPLDEDAAIELLSKWTPNAITNTGNKECVCTKSAKSP